MKSRLRSRWHRPNEKPLESSTTIKKDSAPIGEVQNTGQGFKDDLSSKKPPQKKDFQGTPQKRDNSTSNKKKHSNKARARKNYPKSKEQNKRFNESSAEKVKRTGSTENRKTKKAYTKKNSQKHENNEIKEKKSGLGNFLSRIFGK
ncbi:MAG: hypothetical protein CMI23_05415 [Opitutae bacterium]|nr:hypothetical protein [Opitutae bacterium]|tara:strand:- start:2358 stop:2795 length:438 start_codon:yes stop_codon:yes gene_type:complete